MEEMVCALLSCRLPKSHQQRTSSMKPAKLNHKKVSAAGCLILYGFWFVGFEIVQATRRYVFADHEQKAKPKSFTQRRGVEMGHPWLQARLIWELRTLPRDGSTVGWCALAFSRSLPFGLRAKPVWRLAVSQ